ncbi:MAG: hypothetical protein WCH01_21540, partial [Methylococcaceae bacterium]
AAQFGYILNKTREKDVNEAKRAGEHDESKLVKEAIDIVDQASSESMSGNVAQVDAVPEDKGAATAPKKPRKADKQENQSAATA